MKNVTYVGLRIEEHGRRKYNWLVRIILEVRWLFLQLQQKYNL